MKVHGTNKESYIDRVGKFAAILSLIEVGLGSFLHGFRIPMSGHFLSLNQGFLLSRWARQTDHLPQSVYLGANVSLIAALLKSLSPAGKKLTPMLAIAAQGFLFSLGTSLFGCTFFGIAVGVQLLCLWSFIQPLLIYYFIFGQTLLSAALYYLEKLQDVFHFEPSLLLWVFVAVLIFKAVLGLGVVVLARRLSEPNYETYEQKLLRRSRGRIARNAVDGENPVRAALRDLCNPLFVASFFLTAGFFIFVEADSATLIWGLLRPLAVGFLLFLSVRLFPIERLVERLENSVFKGFGRSLRIAVQAIRDL